MPARKVIVRHIEPERMAGDAETIAELCHLHNEAADALCAAVKLLYKLAARALERKDTPQGA